MVTGRAAAITRTETRGNAVPGSAARENGSVDSRAERPRVSAVWPGLLSAKDCGAFRYIRTETQPPRKGGCWRISTPSGTPPRQKSAAILKDGKNCV